MASNNPFTVSSITNPFAVSTITGNNNDYNVGKTKIPGLRTRTLSLSKPPGSIYDETPNKQDMSTSFNEKENTEDKENEEVKTVGLPNKKSFKESLKNWFTPRKGGKKNKKRNKSKRRRPSRK